MRREILTDADRGPDVVEQGNRDRARPLEAGGEHGLDLAGAAA